MRTLIVLTAIVLLAVVGLTLGHGNNPHSNNTWVGVDIGGTLIPIAADKYLILAALTDIDSFGEGEMVAPNNAAACGELSILICGEGQICCYCYSGNGNQSCSFSCRDESGNCEPCPECGPDIADFMATSAE